MKNLKNKSAVILNPERSEWVSRSHVTSVEIVVNDGAKTKRYSAKRDLYARSPNGSRLKMTDNSLSLSGASSEKQKKSSLILRKAKFQAIFKFVLSSASGGAGGGKYNRISAFVSMPVLLIRRSLEKFFKKNFRDDSSFCFCFAKVKILSFLRLRGASGAQGISTPASCREAHKRRFLLNQWILRLRLRMTIPALALLLTLATTAESWANDSATQNEGTPKTQETQKLLAKEGKCGVGCKYEITTDSITGARNLRVYNDPSDPDYTGVANIASYAFASSHDYVGNHYNYYDNAKFDKITIDGNFDTIGAGAFIAQGATEVVFNGNIKNIGYGAFEHNNLSSVNLPEGLQKIDGEAFHENRLTSITIPDSVTNIGSYAFHGGNVTDVYISDSINDIGTNYPFGSGQRPNIFCKGDELKCQSLVKNIIDYQATEPAGLENYVTGVDKDHCTGEKYFWNGTGCSRKESYCDKDMYYSGYECRMRPTDGSEITCDYDISGYIKVGNNCYSPEVTYAKKHYTPAEANQWLRDGNDNFVVLTFKK